ncbi:hypothetical protein K402DRAFT_381185 [Aulographum hederae CBS 113979]|uniref:UBR-type domain-containing protein n=1 Tax=Aulographum hederae CBS 113979 TaxID=1176131 RepID=A0A6G1GUM2_9PEZI|nr:hypothetical protein K402DRAFT_381185 [Aulographum hederae CBS 113979]
MADSTSQPSLVRSNSISQASDSSQTAQEFINSQLQLEADAREALPYQFDTCTKPLGPLRQSLFSCLTCNPPSSSPSEPYNPAGVCYSCSISCHGEHTLVELFNKRNFVCDCGTTRFPSTAPCTLRIDETTGVKGNVHDEKPTAGNKYNQNFRNAFCGCGEEYNAHSERGTMFQCLGLGSEEEGGCGEDWWHPECIVGLSRDWYKKNPPSQPATTNGASHNYSELDTIAEGEENENGTNENGTNEKSVTAPSHANPVDASLETNGHSSLPADLDDPPLPPGFPDEDDFDLFICYKCTSVAPWIKQYGGTPGFLQGISHKDPLDGDIAQQQTSSGSATADVASDSFSTESSKKRKASEEDDEAEGSFKRHRGSPTVNGESGKESTIKQEHSTSCKQPALSSVHAEKISLFLKPDFRDYFCRCPSCFPLLSAHPQLLEEEESYEPPVSEADDGENGAHSVGTGSLLDRGEAALSNVDRVRAIEGVMVYNHLKDKVKSFLQPFAESGTAVGAEDIKKYFESLRGDAEGIKAAKGQAMAGDGEQGDGDSRKEERGY